MVFLGVVLLFHYSAALLMLYCSVVFRLFHQYSGVSSVFRCSAGVPCSGVPGFIVCLLSCCYEPHKGDNDILSLFLKQAFKNSAAEKKPYYLIGDLNINCLEYLENEKNSTFYNSLFECGAIASINNPTQVAKKSATIIDNVIIINIFKESLKKGIIKPNL